jgi:periplasmic divalent cation tolerance protein
MPTTPPIRLVLTTTASPGDATRIGRTLVEERLAACATLIPSVQSIYRWEGKVESTTETLLLLKTSAGHLDALQTRLLQLHTYQTPEFLVLGVEAVSHPYLEWLLSSLRTADTP